MTRKAIFLDRDGTLIENVPYNTDPGAITLMPGAVEGLRALQKAGFLLVVISNQSLIGRGMGTAEQVEAVNARMVEVFAEQGVAIEAVYYCPHAPEDGCDCRKPAPKLILDAARDHDIDLTDSVMIGDKPLDVEAGQNAGCGHSFRVGDDSDTETSNLEDCAGRVLASTDFTDDTD